MVSRPQDQVMQLGIQVINNGDEVVTISDEIYRILKHEIEIGKQNPEELLILDLKRGIFDSEGRYIPSWWIRGIISRITLSSSTTEFQRLWISDRDEVFVTFSEERIKSDMSQESDSTPDPPNGLSDHTEFLVRLQSDLISIIRNLWSMEVIVTDRETANKWNLTPVYISEIFGEYRYSTIHREDLYRREWRSEISSSGTIDLLRLLDSGMVKFPLNLIGINNLLDLDLKFVISPDLEKPRMIYVEVTGYSDLTTLINLSMREKRLVSELSLTSSGMISFFRRREGNLIPQLDINRPVVKINQS